MSRRVAPPWVAPVVLMVAVLLGLIVAGGRVGWRNLFLTADQRGQALMERDRPGEAAAAFRDPLRRGVALFRAGEFKLAAQVFGGLDISEGAFDQGNALIMLGKYEDAVKRYDRALQLRPDWPDATANRELARIRAERVRQQGGETGNTDSKPDEVVFDKTKKGGTDTTVEGERKPLSDDAVRAMWLRRVQTKPADFLRVKFAYQLQSASRQEPSRQPETKP
ncbi:tetratricopeptide repeat protein [Methylobacterium brachythecii]|uniref:Ca-activated chloride channel family protein n=1 Tax=Methylobacterium brachythecii TaxID=1176177 RepID=A0A7W6ALC3_9HYPH|nr:tetratricopeptide repeat protein [Methylobacterium brachythecii]MBB3902836.1 Ca-activated chloride channel family protein [Methylobacterium brachythecii]GLS43762.1 hypothetical protein GCM10007884_17470 [Methylobacterium brachythecii]